MNGRNFLDLALLIPGVSPTNIGSTQLFAETSAVPGQGLSIGSQRNFSNNFIVDGLSANDDAAGLSGIPYGVDAVEQFQVVTSGGQAELGRALGGYVNVVTKSGTNAAARRPSTATSATTRFNAPNALSGTTLPMTQKQYGAQPRRADRPRPDVLLRELRAAAARSDRPDDDPRRRTSPIINARLAAVGYPGLADRDRHLSEPGAQRERARQGRSPVQRHAISSACATASTTSRPSNSRGAGALNAPSAPRPGSTTSIRPSRSATRWTLSARTVNETRAQFALRRSEGAADRSDRPGRQHRRRGLVRHAVGQPDAARVNKMYQVVDNLSHQAGAHALRAGVDFLYNDDTITYPAVVRGTYTFSSLAELPDRHLQQRRLHPDVRRRPWCRRRTRTSASTRRTSGRPARSLTLNAGPALRPAVPRDDQHRHEQRLAARRLRLVALGVAPHRSSAAAPGSSSTACRSARSPTRCCRPATRPTSRNLQPDRASACRPTQAGAPVFPEHPAGAGADGHARQPHDDGPATCRTRTRGRRASRSSSSSAPHGTVSVGYQYLRGRQPDHVDEPERADVRGAGTNNGCRPNPDLREQQPVFVGRRLELSRPARVVRAAAGRVGQLPRQLHAVEVDEQRRRDLLQLADRSVRHLRRTGAAPTTTSGIGSCSTATVNTSMAPATTAWEHAQPRLPVEQHAAGLLGAAVQHHVRRDHDPGHGGPADRATARSSRATPASAATSSR